jgi:hypothetical protein
MLVEKIEITFVELRRSGMLKKIKFFRTVMFVDQSSATHEWMVWALKKCEGDQRRQKY